MFTVSKNHSRKMANHILQYIAIMEVWSYADLDRLYRIASIVCDSKLIGEDLCNQVWSSLRQACDRCAVDPAIFSCYYAQPLRVEV